MRIRVISSREEIQAVKPTERIVHLTFRPSNIDIINLTSACPKLEAIQLAHSYFKNVSGAVLVLLKSFRIELLDGDVWGHRKDLKEYYEVPANVVNKIKSSREEGKSTDEIKAILMSGFRKYQPETAAFIVEKVLTN